MSDRSSTSRGAGNAPVNASAGAARPAGQPLAGLGANHGTNDSSRSNSNNRQAGSNLAGTGGVPAVPAYPPSANVVSILAQISNLSLTPSSSPSAPGVSAMVQGDVDHNSQLSADIGLLYDNDQFSDVVLNIDGVRIPGHRVVLAARSSYFRALLYGGMKETNQEEVLISESPTVFRIVLRYVYTGQINLSSMREDTLLEVLGMTHVYGFTHLEEAISEYLMANLNIRNVCQIFVAAILFELHSLIEVCCAFIDRYANDVLKHESFANLSIDALKYIIRRDSFCAKEVDIFVAIKAWVEANPSAENGPILELIRLPLMSLPDLLDVVRPSGLIEPNAILDAIKTRQESPASNLAYRGSLIPDENVATARHGAQVLQGEMRSALLDGDTTNYDMERGFTRHHIDDNDGQGILIRLGSQFILNHIKLLIWDKDMRSYSYYIEVSIDEQDWVRVIDHTWVLCRSWQYLYFPKRVVKYIRIVGTHNTVNRVFHVVHCETMFTTKPFTVENGLLVPDYNVATVSNSATVIEGVSRTRNALINGDWQRYDWDTGYTCHQIANGEIVIQLNQPYSVDSLRLLLWDMDIRTYSYYIEVSLDQQNWHLIADKRGEACRSWQMIRFNRRPVVFIRIVGTYNTANEVFHCVHFEMPASVVDPCPGGSESDGQPGGSGKKDSTKATGSSLDDPQEGSSSGNPSSRSPRQSEGQSPHQQLQGLQRLANIEEVEDGNGAAIQDGDGVAIQDVMQLEPLMEPPLPIQNEPEVDVDPMDGVLAELNLI